MKFTQYKYGKSVRRYIKANNHLMKRVDYNMWCGHFPPGEAPLTYKQWVHPHMRARVGV